MEKYEKERKKKTERRQRNKRGTEERKYGTLVIKFDAETRQRNEIGEWRSMKDKPKIRQ